MSSINTSLNKGISAAEKALLQQILNHRSTFATVLHSIVYRYFGEDIYEWDPITLVLEIKDEFDLELPEANQDKLNALIASLVSDHFYHDWAAFTAVCQSLNADHDPLGVSEPLVSEEAAWGVSEIKLNDSSPSPFSEEVAHYVGVILEQDGFHKPPPCLAFAQMPEEYHGSENKSELHQDKEFNQERSQILDTFLTEQILVLLKQLSALPWMTEEQLRNLSQHLG